MKKDTIVTISISLAVCFASSAMTGVGFLLSDAWGAKDVPPAQPAAPVASSCLRVINDSASLKHDGLDVVAYEADGDKRPIDNTLKASESWARLHGYRGGEGLKVPSIHMPRWASRIDLRITEVRAERLGEISEADARAEGCNGKDCAVGYIPAWQKAPCAYHFAQVWENAYGEGSWDEDMWVWAITFERIGGEA